MLNWVEPVQTVSNTVNLAVDTVAVGFLGRPSVDKGVAVLAEAMTLLDGQEPGRFRLVLAGEARFVPTGSQYLVERALAGVVHMVDRTGWITPDNFFSRVDVLVCPSVWPESFGLVVVEAMAARVPVIVSDAGALPEVVGPDYPLMAPAGQSVPLAKLIREFAAISPPGLTGSGYDRWLSLFSPVAGEARVKLLMERLGFAAQPGPELHWGRQ